jgi:hypothetical protein
VLVNGLRVFQFRGGFGHRRVTLDSPTMSDFDSGLARVCKSQIASELGRRRKSQVDVRLLVGCSTEKLGKA